MLTFEEALARSAEIHNKRHALLGNGGSVACVQTALPMVGS